MGRKKAQYPRDQFIRISLKTRMDLWEIRRLWTMPSDYDEAETIEAMISLLKSVPVSIHQPEPL